MSSRELVCAPNENVGTAVVHSMTAATFVRELHVAEAVGAAQAFVNGTYAG